MNSLWHTAAGLLAHQGGWDEALLVATPLAIIGALLWLANRRVSAQLAEAETNAEVGENDSGVASPDID